MSEHRLASIMFSDIVSYTALMEKDEDKAFQILKINREIHITLLERHNGTLIKEMGDGMLASFSSASDAVKCAIGIQEEARLENIPLKIGIHEGEMVFAGADVLGDGVNIASRLQEITGEGSISVSESVYRNIKNKQEFSVEYIGEKTLKNVSEPVKIYRISGKNAIAASPTPVKRSIKRVNLYIIAGLLLVAVSATSWFFIKNRTPVDLPDKSIAILPFINDSEEKETEYFANGVMESILNNLAKVSALRVPGRTSVEQYRGLIAKKTIRKIASELDVSYILEGSVQKFGNQVRVSIQLLDGKNDRHVWSDSYEYAYESQFKIMKEIAGDVAENIRVNISPEEKKIIDKVPTTNMAAYELFLRARDLHTSYWIKEDTNDLNKATLLYFDALKEDPAYAQVYTGLALAYYDKSVRKHIFDANYLDSALQLAEKALSINDQLEEAHYVRGLCLKNKSSDFNRALSELDEALKINPNYALAYIQKGYIYFWNLDEMVKAIENYTKAIRITKGKESAFAFEKLREVYGNIGFLDQALYYANQAFIMHQDSFRYFLIQADYSSQKNNDREQLIWLNKAFKINPTNWEVLSGLGWYYFGVNWEKALEFFKLQYESCGCLNVENIIGYCLWKLGRKDEAGKYFKRQIQDLEDIINQGRLFVDNRYNYLYLAESYAFLGNKKEAYRNLHEFNKYKFYPSWFPYYIKNDPLLESIRSDNEFLRIAKNVEEKYQAEHERMKTWLKDNNLLDIKAEPLIKPE